MSQVIEETLGCDPARIAVASGPNLALEIAREQPTAAVVSSASEETAAQHRQHEHRIATSARS